MVSSNLTTTEDNKTKANLTEILALATGRAEGTERELFFERGTGRLVVADRGDETLTDVVPVTRITEDGFF